MARLFGRRSWRDCGKAELSTQTAFTAQEGEPFSRCLNETLSPNAGESDHANAPIPQRNRNRGGGAGCWVRRGGNCGRRDVFLLMCVCLRYYTIGFVKSLWTFLGVSVFPCLCLYLCLCLLACLPACLPA